VPQEPPQPLLPHTLFVQLGVQVHVPAEVQVPPDGQVPQELPQPSLPHCLPEQLGVQMQRPSVEQGWPDGQGPQVMVPAHPSSHVMHPLLRWAQVSGVHLVSHWPVTVLQV
jgi:hypothetical protein